MSIREHFEELRSRVLRIAIAVVVISAFCMTFGFKPYLISGEGQVQQILFYYPYPEPINNTAIQVTLLMKEALLPPNVKLIQTAPGQAFFAQIHVSLLIGLFGSMPVIVREIAAFISPAINSRQVRTGALKIFLPAFALFAAGAIFSYVVVIPFIIDFLYRYGEALGVETFFTINEFITFVLQFIIGFGIAFELPVVMYGISLTGAISPNFWRNNFRYAVIVLVIFGALITPDGSGVTMWFVAGPMIALYAIGMLAVEKRWKREAIKALQ